MTLLTVAEPALVLAKPCPTELNILKAVIYADVFNYPMTAGEIHRYLEGEALTLAQVQAILNSSVWLSDQLSRADEFFVLKGREGLLQERRQRARASAHLWQAAHWYARWLAHVPFVRMVAVTGALAMDNSKDGDDIDYLIVTAPGRVWLTRAWAIVLVRLARLGGVQLCPNYVLAISALEQERRDLFVAHELAQMAPVVGQTVYWQMRAANAWADAFLPNADSLPRDAVDLKPYGWGAKIQAGLEWLFGGGLTDQVEHWEQQRKTQRFEAELHKPDSAARLDAEHVQGHFNDYGHRALRTYQARCEDYF